MDQLKLLFEYTKFHIGLYFTLITLLIGLRRFGGVELFPYLEIAIACFLVSGAAAGIILRHIPHFPDLNQFTNAKIGFWWWRLCKYNVWAAIEHFAFWLGVGVSGVGYLFEVFN